MQSPKVPPSLVFLSLRFFWTSAVRFFFIRDLQSAALFRVARSSSVLAMIVGKWSGLGVWYKRWSNLERSVIVSASQFLYCDNTCFCPWPIDLTRDFFCCLVVCKKICFTSVRSQMSVCLSKLNWEHSTLENKLQIKLLQFNLSRKE